MDDSPAKKLDFEVAGKENIPVNVHVVDDLELKKPLVEIYDQVKTADKPAVATTIKAEESDEPLLQENPHRFVLFPIKYHEVRVNNIHASRVKCS